MNASRYKFSTRKPVKLNVVGAGAVRLTLRHPVIQGAEAWVLVMEKDIRRFLKQAKAAGLDTKTRMDLGTISHDCDAVVIHIRGRDAVAVFGRALEMLGLRP